MPTQNKQQQAYLYFKALQEKKVLVSLQTPFEYVENMAIESIIAKQTEDTRTISDFTIILKEIRTASTLVETTTAKSKETTTPKSKTALQIAPITNVGTTQGSATIKGTPNAEFWATSRNPLDSVVNEWVNRKKNVPLD